MVPTVSICIPTLNRANTIEQTLESIAAQKVDVEVVVVDGASTDNTASILGAWRERLPRLAYHRGKRNGGVERDTDTAVQLATGSYCWLFTSDDVLKQGALARVLEALRMGPELLIVNAEVRSRDLRERIDGSALRVSRSRTYYPEDFDQLFADTAQYLSYMGGVVIKRELWMDRDRRTYLDSDFIHLGVIFQRKLPGPSIVIADPLIEIRYDNATWSKRAFHIWAFKWPAIVSSFGNVASWARKNVCRSEGCRDYRRLIFFRALGTYSTDHYHQHIAPLRIPRRVKFIGYVIALTPGSVLNMIGLLYARLTKRGRGILSHDLRRSPFYWSRLFRA
jgi:glycosyltransferase involved in cell wall biosynthesis